jgi:hypothetical protein
MINQAYLLAILSFGFGLSLALYRLFALRNHWPMGYLQEHVPIVPVLLGLFALFAGIVHATTIGLNGGGLGIVISGILLAIFWLGFVRVGSQVSLFLAPIAGTLLVMYWAYTPV